MNIKNNKRRKASQEKIEKAFIELLQYKDLSKITVAEICKITNLNRSTFYSNYLDTYDLADKLRDKLEIEVNELYDNDTFNNCGNDYLKLFTHIKENQIFYNTYFKLGYDSKHTIDLSLLTENSKIFSDNEMVYHIEFHKAGLNAVIKKWLSNGCRELPEVMVAIIQDEYTNRH